MHQIKHARPAVSADDLQPQSGPDPGFGHGEGRAPDGPPLFGEANPPVRRARRRGIALEALPPLERRRLAAAQLRKAYGRIRSDFSEAYEHCRNDTQRRALERAHGSARDAQRRALQDRQLDDGAAWADALDALREDRARAERHLARLAAADAVLRILKRLAEMEQYLAMLAA